MGKKKVTDEQIIMAVYNLGCRMREYWECRFGDTSGSPECFRRGEIQEVAQSMYSFQMTSSGFRSRVKKLVKAGDLEQTRFDYRTPFYSLNKD